MSQQLEDCYCRMENGTFVMGNSMIERSWMVGEGVLKPISLQDKTSAKEWLREGDGQTSPPASVIVTGEASFTCSAERPYPGSANALMAKLAWNTEGGEALSYSFTIFPETAAVTIFLTHPPVEGGSEKETHGEGGPTGVEIDPGNSDGGVTEGDIQEKLELTPWQMNLRAYEMVDQTDRNDNLVHVRNYRLGTIEKQELSGCLFCLEDVFDRNAIVFLKHAPLPGRRPVEVVTDFVGDYRTVGLLGHCGGETGQGYAWTVAVAGAGESGLTGVLQKLQHRMRHYQPGLDGVAISNTWGDRNRDAALNTEFICREFEVAQRLGLDACQIDDGWQQGTTSNSAEAAEKGGVWEGFYAADPDFWHPHTGRLPQGLDPIVEKAKSCGVGLGLWFAPDSVRDFENVERDVENLAAMHEKWGVKWIKIDGVKARTKVGEGRLLNLLRHTQAKAEILFDQDITAEIRPGYWPMADTGALFVENRYTDWHRWWPHATLRNIWQLAKVINPSRLRMEFLNPDRNAEQYKGDPLAPETYDPCYIFATLMVTSPLFFCELTGLSEDVVSRLAPLIKCWKQYREEIHTGVVYPVGDCPDGGAWSGFVSVNESTGYANLIVFRELNPSPRAEIELPVSLDAAGMEILSGAGEVSVKGASLSVSIPEAKSYVWARCKLA